VPLELTNTGQTKEDHCWLVQRCPCLSLSQPVQWHRCQNTVLYTGWLKMKYPTRQCALSTQPVVWFYNFLKLL